MCLSLILLNLAALKYLLLLFCYFLFLVWIFYCHILTLFLSIFYQINLFFSSRYLIGIVVRMDITVKQRFSLAPNTNVFLPIFLSSIRHRPNIDIVLLSEHHEITKGTSSSRKQAEIRYRSRELPTEAELPSEIKLVKDKNGATIYVVGTAHLSRDSNHQVLEIIDRVKPDRVMVELCNERQGLMYMSEKAIMDQPDITWSDLVDMAKVKGIGAAVVQLSLMGATDHAKHELQTIPGGEFRLAKQQCDKVPNCKVVLGDRRMSVTFRRLTAAMSTWEKIRFVAGTIWDSIWVKEGEIEEMKQEDTLEKLMDEMKVDFPSAARVILDERDTYLTGMLQATARSPQKVPK
ncbi:unnamed protein product, partial [Oikopleura dioica]